MSIALIYHASGGDIALSDAGIEQDDTWVTMVMIMLFTDARAGDDDVIPDNTFDKRGWPGDSFFDFSIGSKLWLLSREKMTQPVLNQARDYCLEALTPLVEISMAKSIEVETSFTLPDWLHIKCIITKTDGDIVPYSFSKRWDYTLAKDFT